MDQFQIQKHGDEAATLRLWRHTVGIINELPITSASDERRAISEQAGSGVAGKWGKHHFILTAKHLVKDAEPQDVRISPLPSDGWKCDTSRARIIQTLNMKGQTPRIQSCDWEDLALLRVPPDSLGEDVEFVDIANSGIDPPEGEMVHGVGFPISDGLLARSQQIGAVNYRTVMLMPVVFFGRVFHRPTFLASEFDLDRHYLFSYDLADQGSQPQGISGAAAWVQCDSKGQIWTPAFTFAGICTHAYRNGIIERVTRASSVRRFLEEIFGPA